MEKRKRDPVVPEMRKSLMTNRDGRLTAGQWFDLIVQPLLLLGILLVLAFVFFSDLILEAFDELWWLILPIAALLILVPALFRAYRYARMPVHFAKLSAEPHDWWAFRKPMLFYTGVGAPVKFTRRIAPRLPLHLNEEYLVYYLDEPQGKTILSIAPADHEDADQWQPTRNFTIRQEKRARQS